MLKITLNKGLVGTQEKQRKVVRALGLKKFGSVVFHADSPTIRGMVNAVGHLLTVTEEAGNGQAPAPKKEVKGAAEPAKSPRPASPAKGAAKPAKAAPEEPAEEAAAKPKAKAKAKAE